MITNIKYIVIALSIAVSNFVMAQNMSSITDLDRENFTARVITASNSNTLSIYLEKFEDIRIYFDLIDSKGHLLYKRTVDKDNIRDRFKLNMDQLPDGNYTLIVSDKYSSAKKSFKKETEVIIATPIIAKTEYSLVALD
jgi:hypothetical protein